MWDFTDYEVIDLIEILELTSKLSVLGIEQDDDMVREVKAELNKRDKKPIDFLEE